MNFAERPFGNSWSRRTATYCGQSRTVYQKRSSRLVPVGGARRLAKVPSAAPAALALVARGARNSLVATPGARRSPSSPRRAVLARRHPRRAVARPRHHGARRLAVAQGSPRARGAPPQTVNGRRSPAVPCRRRSDANSPLTAVGRRSGAECHGDHRGPPHRDRDHPGRRSHRAPGFAGATGFVHRLVSTVERSRSGSRAPSSRRSRPSCG